MKISELSRRSETPVGRIKYYLREGLLPPGRSMGVTIAEYGDEHVRRLRLIRALTARGGLSIAAARDVLAAVDHPEEARPTLGVLHHALPIPAESGDPDADPEQVQQVKALLEALEWEISDDSPHPRALAASLRELKRLGVPYGNEDLVPYARLAASVARLDLEKLDGIDAPEQLAERAAVVILLLEPVLALLRRLAQEAELRQRRTQARPN
ncbi:transcriptional regulator [Streptomyces hygroscopicus subsp. hygroscopicus]|uniref:MerR family transcriptional regulator n=1 Tax=Streptomyces sp. KHY 26 TaxID=3097359 RepID=UPI0024A5F4F2|nr:MerR family transcriptional regulator [Streptomyces hygroscopicus]GLX47875.1 transcriptional regulator [Streptomyces hygroscopicus subsp. hygroscopicus]